VIQVELVLRFDSDAPEFTRGFEAGALWSQLQGPEPIEATVHATNVEMVMRMAEVTGRLARSEDLNDEWIAVLFDAPLSAYRSSE
jgi:hypothetical protein